MNIIFSAAQNQNIERVYNSLGPTEILLKKEFLLKGLVQVINNKLQDMELAGAFDEVCIDIKRKMLACCNIEKSKRKLVLCLDNIEDEHRYNYSVVHQLGHAQDIITGRVDTDQFDKLLNKNAMAAYFIWDIFLDGRLCREKRHTFFQERSLFYDYKIRMRTLFNSEAEGFFEELWETKNYSAAAIETALARCK